VTSGSCAPLDAHAVGPQAGLLWHRWCAWALSAAWYVRGVVTGAGSAGAGARGGPGGSVGLLPGATPGRRSGPERRARPGGAGEDRRGRCSLPEPLLAQTLVIQPGRLLPGWVEANLSEGCELHGDADRPEQRMRYAGGGEHVFGKVGRGSDGKSCVGGVL
jgi:hypothetical protein